MAMRKLLSKRLFNISNQASQKSLTNCRTSSSSVSVRTRIAPEPGDAGISRRFFHNNTMIRPEIMQMPLGESLIEKLREIDGSKDRIRLDGIAPPTTEKPSLTVEDTRKVLRAAQMEMVKTRLRETGRSWMTYSEFVSVCGEASSDPEDGGRIAKMLDDSANVIVLGGSVCLRPDQVTKTIEGLLPLPKIHNPNDPRRIELKELEAVKAVIDVKAHSLVRRELWAGLGYLVLQTAGFMRLTFWELSWDVMEPICFYVTSMYFMAGYGFFLRTSREPSFEGFYQSRFEAKQRKLMSLDEFDVERYEELKKLFCPKASHRVSKILGTVGS
ncbi:Calcium uniporter protein 2 [Raphanus sativus]|uniref:Calcium uniporter protein 2, mitochondrial-like n=1 Tax=Raphanus sativus TaxID=3726 RepID=A0A9W3DNL4_RAPSA|nr:calcium uniporter protein 2, mitochondrial-like [Raphanus sativus]KAJ4902860.1 Calcium uniporter protein 2 [Raphanus sativus]